MTGLIIKDIINLRGQFKLYLIIFVLWFAIAIWGNDNTFFGGVMMMFVVMLPISVMSYDEKSKWNGFALTMPVSRRELVLAKYVFMGCCILAIALMSFLGNLILCKDIFQSLVFTFYAFPAGLIINAVLMPMMFKYGVEKGRVIFVAAMLVAIAIMIIVVKSAKVWGVSGLLGETGLNVALWAAAIIMTLLSAAISVRVYEKKDF